jgi:hypothetical protein
LRSARSRISHALDDAYGLGEKKLTDRKNLATISNDWFDRLAAQHIIWLVTDADDSRLNITLATPEGQRRSLLAAQFGNVRVFRLE